MVAIHKRARRKCRKGVLKEDRVKQQRRVDEIRSRITKLVNKEAKKLCCCRLSTAVLTSKEFEADMARPCVVHGRRNLGHLVVLTCTSPDEDNLRVMELVRQYRQG